jgi:hypothetical protein
MGGDLHSNRISLNLSLCFRGTEFCAVMVDRNTKIDKGVPDTQPIVCGPKAHSPNFLLWRTHSCQNGNVGGVRIAVGPHVIVLFSNFSLHFYEANASQTACAPF